MVPPDHAVPHRAYENRRYRELILNYFRAQKLLSSEVVEGLNNKAKVTMRKTYGFRTFRCLELARYHSLGKFAPAGIDPRILLTNINLIVLNEEFQREVLKDPIPTDLEAAR